MSNSKTLDGASIITDTDEELVEHRDAIFTALASFRHLRGMEEFLYLIGNCLRMEADALGRNQIQCEMDWPGGTHARILFQCVDREELDKATAKQTKGFDLSDIQETIDGMMEEIMPKPEVVKH